MRKLILILICSITPLFIFSQKKYNDSISSALGILKVHESSLEELSPFEEGGLENIMRLNGKVEEQLLKLLQMNSAVNVPKDTISFFTVESQDQNFAIFNWEEKLGGSFRAFANIFYWKNKDGNPKALIMEEEYAYYDSIYQLKNEKNETLFLLTGGGISCNTCRFEKAFLLKTNETTIDEIFSYQIDYRFNNDIKGLNFDPKNNILSFEYIEDDCEEEEGENCWIRGKFEFNGTTFVEIEN